MQNCNPATIALVRRKRPRRRLYGSVLNRSDKSVALAAPPSRGAAAGFHPLRRADEVRRVSEARHRDLRGAAAEAIGRLQGASKSKQTHHGPVASGSGESRSARPCTKSCAGGDWRDARLRPGSAGFGLQNAESVRRSQGAPEFESVGLDQRPELRLGAFQAPHAIGNLGGFEPAAGDLHATFRDTQASRAWTTGLLIGIAAGWTSRGGCGPRYAGSRGSAAPPSRLPGLAAHDLIHSAAARTESAGFAP